MRGGGFSGGMRGGGMSRPPMGHYPSMSRSPSFSRSPSISRSPSFSRPSQPIRRPSSSFNRPSISRPSTGRSIGSRGPGSVSFPRTGSGGARLGDRQIGSVNRTPGGRIGDRQIGAVDRTPGGRIGDRQLGAVDRTPGNRIGDGQVGRTDRTARDLGRAAIPGLAAGGGAALGSRLSGDMQSQLSARRSQFQQNRGDGAFRDQAGQRFENRDDMVASRRENLQNRMGDRQDFRDGSREDRQNYRDNAREDWQDWAGGDHWNDWDHDHWHDNFGDYWDHMWDEHPGYAAFRVTAWGLNRASYLFGWGDPYYNPYPVDAYADEGYVTDYSQPLVSDAPMEQYIIAGDDVAGSDSDVPAASSDVPPEAEANFDTARAEFREKNYEQALQSVDLAIKVMPKDATLHEFRSLVLFALGRYREATAAIHAVLAVGPGWNWTTMSGLYESNDVYEKQLRKLEDHIRKQPRTADARFLLAYHYMTLGHIESAKKQLQAVLILEPKDSVAADLMRMIGGEVPAAAEAPSAPALVGPGATEAELLGRWTAQAKDGSEFGLSLEKSGEFNWVYRKGDKKQEIHGVFVVDDGVLAMEPDSGGVMVAEVSQPKNGGFTLRQPDDASNDLVFQKS